MDFEVKRRNGILTVGSYLLVFYIVATVIAKILLDVFPTDDMNFLSAMHNLIVYLLLFAAVIAINYKEIILEIKSFSSQQKLFLKILGAAGIFYAISLFANTLVSNIEIYANIANRILDKHSSITSTAENQTAIEGMLQGNSFLPMVLSACIIGPICEELVFRKAFFAIFKSKEVGIVVSSLCFGLIHITSSIGMGYDLLSMYLMTIPYVISGVAFGLVYIKNDCNIVMPTIVHMLSNTISVIGIMFLI